ncbi:MAG: c-type cytochrome [Pseudomonadota bacterium]|nr:c-type cytochrome [Pseudomonadota bacterium]
MKTSLRLATVYAAILAASLLSAGPARAQTDTQVVTRGMLIGALCETCHGPEGEGVPGVPELAGMEVEDMMDTMKDFATGEEETTIMDRHAEGYTEEEIRDVAEYFTDL